MFKKLTRRSLLAATPALIALPALAQVAGGTSADGFFDSGGGYPIAGHTIGLLSLNGWTAFPIPLYPGSTSDNLSATAYDASVFLGFVNRGTPQPAYTYTQAGGYTSTLPQLNTGTFSNIANCSQTGSVAVGFADPGNTSGFQHATRWSGGPSSWAVTDLTPAIVNPGFSQALWVTADGSTVVGYYTNTGAIFRAFSWNGGVLTTLANVAGGNNNGAGFISENGSVIAGFADDAGGNYTACIWNAGVPTSIGGLPTSTFSQVVGGSSLGDVLVGTTSIAAGQNRSWYWTSGTGIVDIGTPDGFTDVLVRACSGDGSVLCGVTSNGANNQTAFVWSASLGFTLLPGTNTDAVAISKDGTVVVGDNHAVGYIWRKQ